MCLSAGINQICVKNHICVKSRPRLQLDPEIEQPKKFNRVISNVGPSKWVGCSLLDIDWKNRTI
jgi:hypothetical protein